MRAGERHEESWFACQYLGGGKQDLPGLWWPWDSSSSWASPEVGMAGTGRGTSSSECPCDVTSAFWRPRQRGLEGHLCLVTILPPTFQTPQPPSEPEGEAGLKQRNATLSLLRFR